MFNVVTVANKRYVHFVKRLFTSLQTSGNDFHLTVFCDDTEAYDRLGRSPKCTVRELPEIRSIGLPRARFAAYVRALQEGGFLYLDSDVIVLKPIKELTEHNQVTGCYDDLSCVRIIPDKRHPWLGDPELENRCFINAGVFFAPRARREFFKELLQRSRNDELWRRYGVLQDNSFLCAHFNLLDEPVDYVDSLVYNWQGLVINGNLQVKRQGNSLVNCRTGQVLKIAHFAGVPDPDAAMCSWPVEVSSLLAAYGANSGNSRNRSLVEFLGTLNPDLDNEAGDPVPRAVLNALVHETVGLTNHHLRSNGNGHDGYLMDREAMLSLIYSKPRSASLWNGLPCGGSFLDGDEYNFILGAIRDLGIQAVVHNGHVDIDKLFHQFNVKALAIHAYSGPVSVQSDDPGSPCVQDGLDQLTGKFNLDDLRSEIESSGIERFDLLTLTSQWSSSEIDRLVGLIQPRYIALYDVHRMIEPVFGLQQRLGARLVGYMASVRGLAIFELPAEGEPAGAVHGLRAFDPAVKLTNTRVRIGLSRNGVTLLPGGCHQLSVTVENLGDQSLSPRYTFPVMLSYHWMTSDHQVRVWDGLRSPLPFDILPGSIATVQAAIGPAPDASCSLVCMTLVQESVSWFDQHDPANRLLIRVSGDEAKVA